MKSWENVKYTTEIYQLNPSDAARKLTRIIWFAIGGPSQYKDAVLTV